MKGTREHADGKEACGTVAAAAQRLEMQKKNKTTGNQLGSDEGWYGGVCV